MSETTNEGAAYIIGLQDKNKRLREELAARDLVIGQMRKALENARLFAARSRKEEWAVTVLRFCAEAGVTGSPLRSTTDALKLRDRKRDAALLREVFDKFYVSKVSLCALADQRESGEWEPTL